MSGRYFKINLALILMFMVLYLLLLPFIHYPWTTLLKPIPIILLMILTTHIQPKQQIEKIFLMLALSFSALGDISLTLPGAEALPMGILAFMVTHCSYICLFLKKGHFQRRRIIAFLPMLLLILAFFSYIWPYLDNMKIPVAVYICLLGTMLLCSFQVYQYVLLIGSGATLFLFSDCILALGQFAGMGSTSLLVMLLYYSAQLLITLGIMCTWAKENC
ncbi:lysoplasmalogenase [Legionella rowbothamii]|uniref:lysoplasmalogenase n=1 Tax=Legionella rowbothamii TaxID=96229 RepID=UPI00105672D5|nr:lysoplasmalogenase [Legionella rowbothamii]